MAESGGPSGKYHRLALAVSAGTPIGEAARAAGVSDRSASRAMQDPKFVRLVRAAQAAVRREVVGRLAGACTEAVEALRGMLRDAPPTARVAAARAVLEHAARWAADVDLADRVAALERAVSGDGSSPPLQASS